jgi:hypothetical protein
MLSEPDLDFTRLTGDAASGGQVEIHGTRRTTGISVRNPRLRDLSAVLRLVPKKSSSALLSSSPHGGENLVPRAIERTIHRGASTACGQRPLSRASRPFVWSPLKGSSGSTRPFRSRHVGEPPDGRVRLLSLISYLPSHDRRAQYGRRLRLHKRPAHAPVCRGRAASLV